MRRAEIFTLGILFLLTAAAAHAGTGAGDTGSDWRDWLLLGGMAVAIIGGIIVSPYLMEEGASDPILRFWETVEPYVHGGELIYDGFHNQNLPGSDTFYVEPLPPFGDISPPSISSGTPDAGSAPTMPQIIEPPFSDNVDVIPAPSVSPDDMAALNAAVENTPSYLAPIAEPEPGPTSDSSSTYQPITDGMYTSYDGGQTWLLSQSSGGLNLGPDRYEPFGGGSGASGSSGCIGTLVSAINTLAAMIAALSNPGPVTPVAATVPAPPISAEMRTATPTVSQNPPGNSTGQSQQYAPTESAQDDAGWEARLQLERMRTPVDRLPALIKKQREIYRQHGITDPSSSPYWPYGN